ncbi:MAG: RNA polymerase sigma factor [Bacteroidota bacterium]
MWLINRKKLSELDDRQLVLDYRKSNSRKVFGVLFDRYAHLVFGVCMKYLKNQEESKDATLSIFEKAMEDLKRFDVEKFSYWIHTVARNYCLMQLRSRKAMIYIDDDEGPGEKILGDGNQEHEPEETEQMLTLLEEAIGTLNEEQRSCIDLFYLKKYCYQDVSKITGLTMNEVKSHIQNGKRNLKIYILKKRHEQSFE